jgi:hypothetical protein
MIEISSNPGVYLTMNGPSDFHVIGTLRDWSVEERLADISVPTLVLSGRYDEATPPAVQPYHDLIPDARWEIFEESSHVPQAEEPERFFEVLTGFLDGIRGCLGVWPVLGPPVTFITSETLFRSVQPCVMTRRKCSVPGWPSFRGPSSSGCCARPGL